MSCVTDQNYFLKATTYRNALYSLVYGFIHRTHLSAHCEPNCGTVSEIQNEETSRSLKSNERDAHTQGRVRRGE